MTALTTAERQSTRRRRLNEAAQAMGYASWSKYETEFLKQFEEDYKKNKEIAKEQAKHLSRP